MRTIKETVAMILNKLPDNCPIEDLHYHLYVAEKIRQSLEIFAREKGIQQEQVEGLLSKWIIR